MAQIFLKDKGLITVKESTEEVFGLLEDSKQFMFLEVMHTYGDYEGEYKVNIPPDYIKTAINKNFVIQAF